MGLKTTLSNKFCSRKAVLGKRDAKTVNWAQNLYYDGVDDHYVVLEALDDPTVVVGRAFCNHLRSCGLLDGYRGHSFVKWNPQSIYQCKVSMVLDCDGKSFKVRAELTYIARQNTMLMEGLLVDKMKINRWLYNLVYNNDEHDKLFDMRIKYLLNLQEIRCFVDDLEIEV